jgi:hypothetical protein
MLSTALQNHPEVCAHGEVLNDRDDHCPKLFGLDCYSPDAIVASYLRSVGQAHVSKRLDDRDPSLR